MNINATVQGNSINHTELDFDSFEFFAYTPSTDTNTNTNQ